MRTVMSECVPLFERANGVAVTVSLDPALVTLKRIAQGFLLGSTIGIPIGLAIGSFKPVRWLLEPWTEFFRFIPAVAMITVSVIWFGIGEESKVFLIAYTTIFVVIISTAAGVGAVGRDKIRAAQCLGANRWQLVYRVLLPAAKNGLLAAALHVLHDFPTDQPVGDDHVAVDGADDVRPRLFED
jgi:ABC-type nitrate/sulfonate/bicarbonate transport system permease component